MIQKKLPIGVQNFEKLIQEGYVYIDKTAYIYRAVHGANQYFLSRPRRFGKSLLLSTLKAYWEGKKEYFTGLDIEKLESDDPNAWQAYPVFYFDFNTDNLRAENSLERVLDEHLKAWEKIYGLEDPTSTLAARFQHLLKRAYSQTGKRCVILVDEYDKPLIENMDNSDHENHNKEVFKGFFSTLKSYDEYIQFVFITGVTKFSKVSIFSDLNQLKDISLSKQYAGICGITEKEIEETFADEIKSLAKEQKLSVDSCLQSLKSEYDGYHFHQSGEGIYNPYSLLNAFTDLEFKSYWYETGTPTFLVKKLKDIGFDIRKFSDLSLEITEDVLSDYNGENTDPVPLLYQTGYLTIKGYDSSSRTYTVGFPNNEVKYGFLNSFLPQYTPDSFSGSGKSILEIRRYIQNGDLQLLQDALIALYASIPYTSSNNVPYEHYFQTVLYLVFTLLGQYVHCELHSSRGRADCIVETDKYVYIFEFKMDKSSSEALEQIYNKGYAAPYKADSRTVYAVGVNFDSETRTLNDFEIDKIS
ncbi:ATP-binding protein [Butyrivibrio fibrisolvens]|uniref:ATP-binding protein n=1 Tax=Butyrivibrio fibrisolvens TaxID=831 RepID=UPI0004159AEA|nr:ATP-binding protein [Butyrivibrio fibrisolvens]